MAHKEAPEKEYNAQIISFPNCDGTASGPPTVNVSGSLYVSGGALYYNGYGATQTEIAAS